MLREIEAQVHPASSQAHNQDVSIKELEILVASLTPGQMQWDLGDLPLPNISTLTPGALVDTQANIPGVINECI